MWRSLQVLILTLALAACGGGHPEWVSDDTTTTTAPAAAAQDTATTAPATTTTTPAPAPAATQPVADEPTPVESGVIHEYCVRITFVTHFRPGTTVEEVRTFSDALNQQLCVDGHPRGTNTSGSSTMADGQEIDYTAQFL